MLVTLIIMLPLGSFALIGEQIAWPDALFAQTPGLTRNAGNNAANALDKLNNANKLLPLMRDPHAAVRLGTAHALGDLKDKRALLTLNSLLKHEQGEVLQKILWAKNEIEGREHGQ